tara:strand:+ start:225 stop:482 length:258 start_codon:yes stop_codon:yes gene_type:complete
MNNKGQVIFFTLMIAIVFIIIALALSPGLKIHIDEMRGDTNLDCGNSSISTFDKGTCFITDLSMPYFIGALIFLAGVIITARLIG